ncbi:DUF397 domain-containing protein [Lentzea flaviverrucosa]
MRPARVGLRDSKSPESGHLEVSRAVFARFVRTLAVGD